MNRIEQMKKSYDEVLAGTAIISRSARGHLHHDSKPAIITSLRQEWYKNGQLDRQDGPAIMCLDTKVVDYWANGKYVMTEDWSDTPDLFEKFLWKEGK